MSVSPYRLPEQQTGLINPWREPAAPHGGPPADSAALHELLRLRQRYHLESSDDRTWGIVGLIGCGSVLLVVPLGLLVGGWVFLLALKLGLLPVGMGYLVMHMRGTAKRVWKDAYTAMYFKLATTGLPLLIADAQHAAAADQRSASSLAQATAARPDLVATMLRVAQFDLAADQPPQPVMSPAAFTGGLPEPRLDMAARARFAAIYDFFFHPQEEFHAELEQQRSRAMPVFKPAGD